MKSVFAAASLLLFMLPAVAQQASVTQLTPDVYHFRYGFHSNIFVVTDAGVLVTDPLSPAAAAACLAEIRRITDQPVRYVVYSHDHTDHIAGGAVYQGQAQFVAQRRALDAIVARGIDEIVAPGLLVDERHTIELGGKHIQLVHLGRIESASSLAILVVEDKVLMWVDAVRSFGAPYRYLEGYDLRDFRRALEELQGWDFDILVPGHGPPTDKKQVALFADYFAAMEQYAVAAMAQYTQSAHRAAAGDVNPERYYDTYIEKIAGRVSEKMRPDFGRLGGYDDWGIKNAERMVVFLLHENLFAE